MTQELLSPFDIASRLNLHIKTVRNYVRAGRLKAIRVGKQYRIARTDLEAFLGHPLPPTESESAKRRRHVEVSSVAQIDAISGEDADRLENALAAFAHASERGAERLRIQPIYDPQVGRLKIIFVGAATPVSAALKLMASLVAMPSRR